jgi:hypothetical protein
MKEWYDAIVDNLMKRLDDGTCTSNDLQAFHAVTQVYTVWLDEQRTSSVDQHMIRQTEALENIVAALNEMI